MPAQNKLKNIIDALSPADITIKGKLFAADSDSITITCDGVQYDVLLEYINNSQEIAKIKPGDSIEVKVAPNAKIVQKQIVSPAVVQGMVDVGSLSRLAGLAREDPTQCCECLCAPGPGFCDCICDEMARSYQQSPRRFLRKIVMPLAR
jgi:hypothetical protein